MRVIKSFGVAVAAAIVAGVLIGSASRLLMRFSTLAAGHEGDFSWSGSFFIVMIFVLAILPAAVAAAFTTRRWRWLLGLTGALFLCLPAVGVASAELGTTDGWSTVQWIGVSLLTVAIFGTIFAAPAAAIWFTDRLRRPA